MEEMAQMAQELGINLDDHGDVPTSFIGEDADEEFNPAMLMHSGGGGIGDHGGSVFALGAFTHAGAMAGARRSAMHDAMVDVGFTNWFDVNKPADLKSDNQIPWTKAFSNMTAELQSEVDRWQAKYDNMRVLYDVAKRDYDAGMLKYHQKHTIAHRLHTVETVAKKMGTAEDKQNIETLQKRLKHVKDKVKWTKQTLNMRKRRLDWFPYIADMCKPQIEKALAAIDLKGDGKLAKEMVATTTAAIEKYSQSQEARKMLADLDKEKAQDKAKAAGLTSDEAKKKRKGALKGVFGKMKAGFKLKKKQGIKSWVKALHPDGHFDDDSVTTAIKESIGAKIVGDLTTGTFAPLRWFFITILLVGWAWMSAMENVLATFICEALSMVPVIGGILSWLASWMIIDFFFKIKFAIKIFLYGQMVKMTSCLVVTVVNGVFDTFGKDIIRGVMTPDKINSLNKIASAKFDEVSKYLDDEQAKKAEEADSKMKKALIKATSYAKHRFGDLYDKIQDKAGMFMKIPTSFQSLFVPTPEKTDKDLEIEEQEKKKKEAARAKEWEDVKDSVSEAKTRMKKGIGASYDKVAGKFGQKKHAVKYQMNYIKDTLTDSQRKKDLVADRKKNLGNLGDYCQTNENCVSQSCYVSKLYRNACTSSKLQKEYRNGLCGFHTSYKVCLQHGCEWHASSQSSSRLATKAACKLNPGLVGPSPLRRDWEVPGPHLKGRSKAATKKDLLIAARLTKPGNLQDYCREDKHCASLRCSQGGMFKTNACRASKVQKEYRGDGLCEKHTKALDCVEYGCDWTSATKVKGKFCMQDPKAVRLTRFDHDIQTGAGGTLEDDDAEAQARQDKNTD